MLRKGTKKWQKLKYRANSAVEVSMTVSGLRL